MKRVCEISMFLILVMLMIYSDNAQAAYMTSGNPPLYDNSNFALEVSLGLGKVENSADFSGEHRFIEGKLGKEFGTLGVSLDLRYQEDDIRWSEGSDESQLKLETNGLGLIFSKNLNFSDESKEKFLLYGSFLIADMKNSEREVTGGSTYYYNNNYDIKCGAIGIQWEGKWNDGSGFIAYSQIGLSFLTDEDDDTYDYSIIKVGTTIYSPFYAVGFDIEKYEENDSDFSMTIVYGSLKFFF